MSDRPQLQKQPSKYEIRQRLSSIDNELRISKVDLSHLNALTNNKDIESSQWKERVIAIEKSTKRQTKLERKRHGRYSTGNISSSSLPSSNSGGVGGGSDGIGTSLKDRLATFQKATKETINYYSDDESTVGPKNKKTAAQLLKEQYARKQRLAGKRAVEKRMAAAPQSNTMGNNGGLNALSSLGLRDMGMTADGCKPKLVRANSADSIFSNDQDDNNNRQPLVLAPPAERDNEGERSSKGGKGGFDMGVGKPTSTKRVSMTSKVSSAIEEDDQSVLSSNYNLSIKQRTTKFGLSTSHLKTQSQRLDKLQSSNRKSGINNTQVIEKRMSAKEKMLLAKQVAEEKRLAGIKEKDKRGEKLSAKEKMLLAKSIKDDRRKAKVVEGIDKKEEERNESAKRKEEEAQQLIDKMMLDMNKDGTDESAAVTPPSDTSNEQKDTTTSTAKHSDTSTQERRLSAKEKMMHAKALRDSKSMTKQQVDTPSTPVQTDEAVVCKGDTSPEKKRLTAKEKMMQAKALRDSKRTTLTKQPQVDTTSPTEFAAADVDQVSMTVDEQRCSNDEPTSTPFMPTLTIDDEWQGNNDDVNVKKAVTDFYRPTTLRRMANKDTVPIDDDQEVKTSINNKKEDKDTHVESDEQLGTPEEKKLTAKEKMLQAKALAKSRRMSKKQEEAAVDDDNTSPSAPILDNTSDNSLNEKKVTSIKKDNIPIANNDKAEKKLSAKEKMLQAKALTAVDCQVTSSEGTASATPITSANQPMGTSDSTVKSDNKTNMSMVKDTTFKDTADQASSDKDASDEPPTPTKSVVYNPYDKSTWHLKKKKSSTNEKTVSNDQVTAAVDQVAAATSTDEQKGIPTINNVREQDQVVVPSSTTKSKSSDVESTTDTPPLKNPAVYNPYDKSTWYLKKQQRKSIDTDKKLMPDVSSKAVESPVTVSDDKVSTKLLESSADEVISVTPQKADDVDQVALTSSVNDNDTTHSSPPKPMVYNPYDMSTWHLKKSKTNNNDKMEESPATVVPPEKETLAEEKNAVKDTSSSVVQEVTSSITNNGTANEKIVESPVLEKTPSPSQQKKMTAKEKMLQSKALAHSKRLEKLAQEKKRQEAIDEAWLADQSTSSSATNDEHAEVVNTVRTVQKVKAPAKSDASKRSVDQVTSSSSTKEPKKDMSSSNEKIVDSLGKMMSVKEMSMHAKSIAQSKRLAASDQVAPNVSKVDNPRPVSEFKKLFGSGAVSQETVEHIKAEAIKVEKQRQLAQEKTLSSLEKDRHAQTTDKSNDTAEDTPVDTPLVTSSMTKAESPLSTDKNDKAEKRRLAKEKMLQAKALTQSKRLERQAALDARANRLADLEKKSTNNQSSTSGASSTNELYQTKKKTLVSGDQAVSMVKETPDASRTSVSTSVGQATCLERVKAEAIAAEKELLDAAWLADQSMTSREGSLANLDVSHRSTSSTDYNMIEESSFVSFTQKELIAREKMMQAKARASQSKRSSISKRLEKLTDGINETDCYAGSNDDAKRDVSNNKQTNKMGTVISVTDEQKAVSSIRTAEEAIKSESNPSEKKLTAKEKMKQAKALTQSKRFKKVAEEKKRQEAIDEAWLAEQEGLATKKSESIGKSSNESKNISESKKTVEVEKKSTKDKSIKVQGQVAPVITITTSDVNDSAFTSKFKKEIVNEAAIENPKMLKTFAQSQQSTKVVTKEKLVKSSPEAKSTAGTVQSTTPNATLVVKKKSTSEKKLTAKERMVAAKARAQQKRLAAQLERERLEKVKETEAKKKKSQAKKLAEEKTEAEKKRQAAALDAAWLSEQLEEAEDEELEERLELEQKSRAAAKAAYRRRSAHGSSNISDGEDNTSGGLGSLGLLSSLPSSKKKVSKCLRSVTENEDDDASVFTTKTLQTLQSQHTNAAKSVSSRSYYSRVHDEASIANIVKDKARAKLEKKKHLSKNPQILKTYKQWEKYHLENGRFYSTIEGELWSQKCYKNNPNGIVSRPVLPPDVRIAAVKAFLIARGLGRDDIKY